MKIAKIARYASPILATIILSGCDNPLDWPQSPLYQFPDSEYSESYPDTLEEAKNRIVGHYAHYDIVAYEENQNDKPMRTFIVSYGFTDFYLDNGKLMESDRFCHAEHKINQKGVKSTFSDAATPLLILLSLLGITYSTYTNTITFITMLIAIISICFYCLYSPYLWLLSYPLLTFLIRSYTPYLSVCFLVLFLLIHR